MIYFCADLHLGHQAILRLTQRPFDSVEEMDNTIIKNFNSIIRENDDVYHLGDFAFRNERSVEDYFSKLNGRWHFILGNHDNRDELVHLQTKFGHKRVPLVTSYTEIKYNKLRFVLFHYPIMEWNGKHHGYIHLFGHSHGKIDYSALALDVGVDNVGFYPILIDKVIEMVNKRKEQPIVKHNEFSELYDLAMKQMEYYNKVFEKEY